jgi:hypothetical protein
MHDISVKLWRNHHDQDWSAEINGTLYKSVTIDVIEGLIQHAIMFGDGPPQKNERQRIH